ncbi:MAG: methionyl-tRNA formyltransferase [Chloroflexi bacterium]|nr:MAG: methionyl-tRNA formyltransferase [Chloroflexota bacterium]
MGKIRIVYMGTPDFAVLALAALHESGAEKGWQVVGVVTQPDRPAGRGKRLLLSPVKEYALAHGLPVLQPGRLRREPEAIGALAELAADVMVVAAYGQILPKAVLEIPTFGCLNIHASLLPAWRGASPITAALLAGQSETGVTLMLMDVGMDTGPLLAQAKMTIGADDTTASLSQKLAAQGAALLVESLPRWLAGEIAPLDQADLPGTVSLCALVKKEDGQIDWSLSAAQIERMVRAYTPWPSAFTTWKGQNFKIWQARVIAGNAGAGEVVLMGSSVAVGTGDGLLELLTVQPAGKRALDIRSFRNGAPDFAGSRLGEREEVPNQ